MLLWLLLALLLCLSWLALVIDAGAVINALLPLVAASRCCFSLASWQAEAKEQGLAALEPAVKHLRAKAEAGKLILIALPWNQHAAGASKPIQIGRAHV